MSWSRGPFILLLALACRESLTDDTDQLRADPHWLALLVGDTVRLRVRPAMSPDTLPGTSLAWASSNGAVARVSPEGLVTGVGHGVATVTARSAAGAARATIVVAPPVVLAAGDIATCNRTDDEATAALLDGRAGVVLPLGDNAYENGSASDYDACYGPSWGRHKARSRPAPGNHEYQTPDAAGYFVYFGLLAGEEGLGYYSWDFAGWHFVSLNSNIDLAAGSPQDRWLRDDLASSAAPCTLAYWHHPLFTSNRTRRRAATRTLWTALAEAGADVVLVGHAHNYERFAPQTPTGVADEASGVRQFVVGTGGHSHHGFDTLLVNSVVRDSTSFGVLALTLRADGYSWRFVPVPGASQADSGSGACH